MNDIAPGASTADAATAKATVRPLRTWPALILAMVMVLARYGPAYLEGGLSVHWMISVFGPIICSLLLLIWWLTASRATWKERVFGLLGLIGSIALVFYISHPTIRGAGTFNLTVPLGMLTFAVGASLLSRRRPAMRTGGALLFALAGFGVSAFLRNEGMTGDYAFSLHWRWSKSAEDLMLAARESATAAPGKKLEALAVDAAALANPEWPGYRGADRSGISQGPRVSTNWTAQPPQQLWKTPIGPGWSSFAVAGNFLFTQEQRGPEELVVCYDAETGREIWKHEMAARFDEALGGPGPRATPTLGEGGLFVTGATGILMRLDPATGALAWKQDLKQIAGRETPMWGFAASPLVTRSTVIVHAGGPGDKGLLAFDAATGALRWSVADGNDSYGSPQLSTVAGEEVILMLTNEGLHVLDPGTGQVRLNYAWKFENYRCLQPRVVAGDTILLPTGMTTGTRAIHITKTDGKLAAQESWTSRNLKPDFTDIVTHQGYAYGIDGGIFTCVDLKTGERKWKAGRYGKGQVLLLEKSDLLLIAAEDGRVVLLRADPAEHREVATFKALEGKTWNHPVVVGDRLYVRNSQEAAGYRLPLATAP